MMYKGVERVLIGDGVNAAAITHVSGIKKGDLFLVRSNGQIISSTTGSGVGTSSDEIPKFEKVFIAMGIADGEFILSSPIQGNTVSKYEGTQYVAPVEGVSILGYYDTAGQGIEATEGEQYRLRVLIKDDNRVQGQRPTFIDVYGEVAVGETDEELAYKIAQAFGKTDYGVNSHTDLIQLERVCNGTRTAFVTSATASVTKGSKLVTFGAAHTLSVGDVVKFQGAAYIIAAVPSTTTVTLDMMYVGSTETILVADADSGSYAAITDWGFKITGLKQTASNDMDEYEYVSFTAAFANVDGTEDVLVTETAATGGQGYWKQVRDEEEAAKSRLGDTDKIAHYANRIASNVVEDETYGSIMITHAEIGGGNMQDTQVHPLQTNIYLPAGSDQGTNTGTNFLALLNGYFSSVLDFTAVATLA